MPWPASIGLAVLAAAGHAAVPAAGASLASQSARLSDSELAGMRGGFLLANGMEVQLAIQTLATVDGQAVLSSLVSTNGGTGGMTVVAQKEAGASANASLDVNGRIIRYQTPDLAISQVIGRALGAVVENRADNRSLAISSTVTVAISNVNPVSLGGTGAYIGHIASDPVAIAR